MQLNKPAMYHHSEEVAMNKPQRTDRQTGKTFIKVLSLFTYALSSYKQDFSF